MEMSVDKTIEFYNGLECYTPQAKDARDVAITTMRKYQKIEQILNRSDDFIFRDAEYRLQEIREVVEDGNDNN